MLLLTRLVHAAVRTLSGLHLVKSLNQPKSILMYPCLHLVKQLFVLIVHATLMDAESLNAPISK